MVTMKKKTKKWFTERQRRRLLDTLIEQQQRDMNIDSRRSVYGVNQRLKKI